MTTPMLTPSYPWGQGSPARMVDPEMKQGAYEKPQADGGWGGALAISAFFIGVGLLIDWRRRRRK